MRTQSTIVIVVFALALAACKGCKKDGNGTNPSLDDLELEVCDNGDDDNGDGLTDCAQPVCQTDDNCTFEPPDPAGIAPPVDPMNLIGFADSVRFLWEGDNPVIRGVDPDALDVTQVAVLRARIVDRDGNPIPGILANVAGQPGLGYTFSRADGAIDLVANGGAPATIRMRAPGFLPVDRSVETDPLSFATAEEAVLTPISSKVTELDGGGLAPGEPTTDDDGERTARVWFPKDTVATVHLPDGQQGDVAKFHVRLTEYTVGDTGPAAMPALLPENSAYTYAVELSLDEAEEIGANEVSFSKTGWLFLDNFLGFDVGAPVPSGYYSRARNSWEAEVNGRVLKRVSDGVDIDGSGSAASKSAREEIGLSNAELDSIKKAFADGEEFWRVPVEHFSPFDLNWPYELPEGAVSPDEINIKPVVEEDPCAEAGSIIECQNQTMMQSIPLPGTGHSLVYRSDRTLGRLRAFELPLTGDEVPDILQQVQVIVEIAGRRIEELYDPPPPANFTYTFEWDGLDIYGRPISGETPIRVSVAHFYEARFTSPAIQTAFGTAGGSDIADARILAPIRRRYRGQFGSFDAKGAFNMGGWALDLQHAYDGGNQTFYPAGSPEQRRSDLSRVIENFEIFATPTNLPVEPSKRLYSQIGVFAGRDNALFFALHAADMDSTMFVKRHADGRLEHWAGKPVEDFEVPPECQIDENCGEGGDPKEAISVSLRWAIGPDDTIYASSGKCLRAITEDSFEKIAGDCLPGEEPDNQFDMPRAEYIAVGPNSEIYVSDGVEIARVYPGEKRVDWLAGCAFCETPPSAGAAPQDTDIGVEGLVATPNGDIYFLDKSDTLIRLRNGRLEPVAFSVADLVEGMAAGPDNSVYWIDAGPSDDGGIAVLLHRYKGGNVSVIAGTSSGALDPTDPNAVFRAFAADGIAATEAFLQPFGSPAIANDGSVYMPTIGEVDKDLPGGDDEIEPVIKRIGSAYPSTLGGDEALLASPNGRYLYRFAPTGQLQDVRSSWNNLALETLTYGDDGLTKVTNRDGLETTIERDARGHVSAIVGPYGHRTAFTLDANGYIADFGFPDGSAQHAEYTDRGLMTGWQDAVGADSTYDYDVLGFLTRAEDPEGGWKTLTRTATGVVLETASGRRVDYSGNSRLVGSTVVTTDATGRVWQSTRRQDGSTELVEPDGTTRTSRRRADPRFGRQSEFIAQRTTTTPSGLTQTSQRSYEVVTSPGDPLKLRALTKNIDINGAVTTYVYDGDAHTTTRTSAEGRVTAYAYDAKNRMTSFQRGDFDPLDMAYDDNGRIVRLSSRGITHSSTYAPDGSMASVTTPDGTTTYTHDENGRLVAKVTPSGIVQASTYDADGRRTSLTFDSSSIFTFAYNGYGLPSEVTQPTGESDAFAWTSDQRLGSILRANGTPLTIQYDTVDRVSGWGSTRGDTIRTFDADTGQTTRTATPDGAVAPRWDGFLIAGLDIEFEGQTHSIDREFDDNFRVTKRSVDGTAIAFEYDLDGVRTRAGDASISHGSAEELTSLSVGGLDVDYVWSPAGLLTSLTYSNGATTLYGAAFTYDSAGRRESMQETVDGTTVLVAYTYDQEGQLTTVSRDGAPAGVYTFDSRGNRTGADGIAITYDAADRVVAAGSRSYDVDESGFVTGWTEGTTTSLTFDGWNLYEVVTPTGTIEYGYDDQDRRIWRTVDGAFDRGWLYDDHDRPVAEVDSAGAIVSRFVYATRSFVPTYMVKADRTYLFVAEPNGNVRALVDTATGQASQRIDYDALVNILNDSNPEFQPFGFAAGLQDPTTKLVRLGVRDYDPVVGRFISPEPEGFRGGQPSLYMYAYNDPINLTDPHGTTWVGVVLFLAGALGLAAAGKADIMYRWEDTGLEDASNERAKRLASLHHLTTLDSENAMRHCTRGCDQIRRGGVAGSEAVTRFVNWGHELEPQNWEGHSEYYDSLKDEHTNKKAIICASQPGTCLNNCERMFNNGELATDTPVAPDMSVDAGMSRLEYWVGTQ